MQIYLSYRHDDTKVVAERITDQLIWRYRAGTVIRDISGQSLEQYTQLVHNTIAHSNVILVVIGPYWVSDIFSSGAEPIHIQVAAALASGKLVVPLLVHGARMPSAQELPADLAALSFRQAYIVRPDPQFQEDMRKVYEQINTQLAWHPTSPLLIVGGSLLFVGYVTTLIASLLVTSDLLHHRVTITSILSILLLVLSITLFVVTCCSVVILSIRRRQYLWLVGTMIPIALEILSIPLLRTTGALLTVPWYATMVILFGLFSKRREVA